LYYFLIFSSLLYIYLVMVTPVNITIEDVRAEKAASAEAARKVVVKSEEDCIAQPCADSSGKRRKLAEGRAEGERSPLDTSRPPGFSAPWDQQPATGKDGGKHWRDDGNTGDWKAARQLLQGTVTPSREREMAASDPADVVAASHVSLLKVSRTEHLGMFIRV
jgi:hypothetical protein